MINYLFARFFLSSFRLIPFWLLYRISDMTRFLLFVVIGYRKKVILENLQRAFPEKSKSEIRQIASGFYKNFTDVFFEALKGFTMRKKEMLKRFKLVNPDFLAPYFEQGQSVLVLGAHYSNWEWGTSLEMQMRHETATVYKSIKNPRLNQYMHRSRERWGMKQVPVEKTRHIFSNIETPRFIVLIADQSYPIINKAVWINFLGIETACIPGPEKYSSIYNFPVLFLDFKRVKRGYYNAELSLISDNPKELQKDELTKRYMAKLESVILSKPENWLWTHKRWKYKKEGDQVLVDYYYK
jgi:Kdo2-lipid IVA lauroyltransferase/acyltransferase